MGVWAITAAWAAVPVVYDGGDATAVVAEVSARTGLPTSELVATRLEQLLQQPAGVVGDAAIRRCARPNGVTPTSTMIEVRAEIARGEAAWATDHDPYAAIDHLDLAVAGMGCLGEVVDRQLAATAFALRGGVEAELGQADVASSELRTALALWPELQWADHWPAGGRALLDAARADTSTVRVDRAPDASASGPWLDGQLVADGASARHGLHLLQYSTGTGIASAWVTLGGDAVIVAPPSYRRPVLQRIQDPAGRAEVELLLRAALPQFTAGYVVVDGGTWLVSVTDGAASTIEVAAPAPAAPVEQGKKPKKGKGR